MRNLLWLLTMLLMVPAYAADLMGEGATMNEDGLGCIDLGKNKNAQTMKNICRERIYVMWCHDPSSLPGTKNSECGSGDHRYYTHNFLLDPGEMRDNLYTMPLDAKLHYGVCVGGSSWDTRTVDNRGGYICNIKETPGDNEVLNSITVVGENANETCEMVKAKAKGSRYIGKCSCMSGKDGRATVCRVQAISKAVDVSWINKLQGMMREQITVEEVVVDSKDPNRKLYIRNKTAAFGVRG